MKENRSIFARVYGYGRKLDSPMGLVSEQTDWIDRVREWLEWPEEEAHRLTALDGEQSRPFSLPTAGRAREILARLDVPREAADEVVLALPALARNAEALWLLERLHDALVRERPSAPPWPAPVVGEDPLSRYFHLYVFLAAVPSVLDAHARRGVPADVTWKTLGDVGLQVAHYHARHGTYGFDGAFWVFNHFRGRLFQLGRLQFELAPASFGSQFFSRGDPVVEIHIPALGPLTPEACDDAFARARRFFRAHYPEDPTRYGTCTSWLLDEQLADYLPASSNIVRFQRRFTNDDWCADGDGDTIRFTFGHLPEDLEELPQRTTLERAIVAHLRGGGHWRIRRGYLEI